MFDSLVKIANQKELDEIRVIDITTEANIHRATFYRHVESIQDLLERGTEFFLNDILLGLEETRKNSNRNITENNLPDYLYYLFSQVEERSEVFKAFLFQKSSNYFQSHLRERIKKYIINFRLFNFSDEHLQQHTAEMISACLLVTVEQIVLAGSIEPFAKNYYRLVSSLINKIKAS